MKVQELYGGATDGRLAPFKQIADVDEKEEPGAPMPQGAPIRFRTKRYDAIVDGFAARLVEARDFAAAHPGARGERAIADAKRITVAMKPSSRNDRRRSGEGDIGTRGLKFQEAKTFLDLYRYAMNEAIARVFGANAVQEQRGRFRIYGRYGSCVGRADRRTYTSVPFFIRGERVGTFETMAITAEEVG